jgi:hypothetical protein
VSSRDNRVSITVRGDLAGGVLPAVVAMLAARAECPLDRLDEALLLTDAIAAHAPARSAGGDVHAHLSVDEDGLEVVVDALEPGGASGLIDDATLPDVGGVLERIADEVDVQTRDGAERLVLRLRYETPAVGITGGDEGRT